MSFSKLRTIVFVAALAILAGGAGWLGLRSWAADPAGPVAKGDEKKPAILLPKDPDTVVLSMQVKGGMILNKTPDPYLLIRADGGVVVTNRVDGKKKESKLTPEQLTDLLRFVIQDNDFFALNRDAIAASVAAAQAGGGPAIAVGDGTTTTISVHANDKVHNANYYAAGTYSSTYPKAKALGQYAAIEKRLQAFALSVEKGK